MLYYNQCLLWTEKKLVGRLVASNGKQFNPIDKFFLYLSSRRTGVVFRKVLRGDFRSAQKQPFLLALRRWGRFAFSRWKFHTDELVRRWTQHFGEIDQEKRKTKQFGYGTSWLPDILCKHSFTSSVWNFCRWVADVPPCETSPAVKSEEKLNGCFRRLGFSLRSPTPSDCIFHFCQKKCHFRIPNFLN